MSDTTDAPVAAPPGMVHVPAGTFFFGRGRGKPAKLAEFWIDRLMVTNADYQQFALEHHRPAPRHWPPSGLPDEMLDLPVVYLTYAEAEAYAVAVGKRLPTAAQFEKAARGTDGRRYPWGNQVRSRIANTREASRGGLTSVEAFPESASPYGCLDMAGNALHWTRTIYDPEANTHALKGGCFREYLGACAWFYESEPGKRQEHVGLRCVWSR